MKLVCNYAPLRFLPYRETGEFVNVGIVVHCPQVDFLGFRTVPLRKTGRLTGFFPELEAKLFRKALQGMTKELERLRAAHRLFPTLTTATEDAAKAGLGLFRELVRTREGLLHFGEAGMALADDPEAILNDLYGRYIERQFAQKKEYQETVMRSRLAQFLRQWNLSALYETNCKVGDGEFHVVMPFVHYDGSNATKAIKPLDLDKGETSDIYHHGGAWVKNMERLKKRNCLPAEVVFTVKLPDGGKRQKAAADICAEFTALGVKPIHFENVQLIRDVATVEKAA